MIPKIIHYCWFGGKPLNKLGKKCKKSWKKYFPDYEIIEWNESNFDINSCKYVKEAYEAKKYAFVSDYVRFKVLYEQGGLYFDTDVEVIKPFDKILKDGNFMGCENPASSEISVAPGLGLAVVPGLDFYKEILEDYEKSSFYKEDGSLNLYTVVQRATDLLYKHGLQNTDEIQEVADIKIYPTEYFCPIDMRTGKLNITENTYSIHRYAASWCDNASRRRGKIYRMISRVFGVKFADKLRNRVK
ncbi:MAG: glycosyl transferase [Clostridia bacterium]|nr:glycosyl transferase [Clostridia bacterium]